MPNKTDTRMPVNTKKKKSNPKLSAYRKAAQNPISNERGYMEFSRHLVNGSLSPFEVVHELLRELNKQLTNCNGMIESGPKPQDLKLQAKHTANGNTDAKISVTLFGKNNSGITISAGIILGTVVENSDLSALSDAINAYSSETGIVASLSEDKYSIYLKKVNGNGGIQITNIDFSECDDATNPSLLVNGDSFAIAKVSATKAGKLTSVLLNSLDKKEGGQLAQDLEEIYSHIILAVNNFVLNNDQKLLKSATYASGQLLDGWQGIKDEIAA